LPTSLLETLRWHACVLAGVVAGPGVKRGLSGVLALCLLVPWASPAAAGGPETSGSTDELRRLAVTDLDAFARRITEGADGEYEEARAATRWFAENFDWTATDYQQRTLEQIFERGGGNCAELARVTTATLERLGLPMRQVREINLHVESERRQKNAEAKVAEVGPRASVFGRRHNDHVWIEIQDRSTGEWFPAERAGGSGSRSTPRRTT
jgi:transglutaminase-like putative cysteine protease